MFIFIALQPLFIFLCLESIIEQSLGSSFVLFLHEMYNIKIIGLVFVIYKIINWCPIKCGVQYSVWCKCMWLIVCKMSRQGCVGTVYFRINL